MNSFHFTSFLLHHSLSCWHGKKWMSIYRMMLVLFSKWYAIKNDLTLNRLRRVKWIGTETGYVVYDDGCSCCQTVRKRHPIHGIELEWSRIELRRACYVCMDVWSDASIHLFEMPCQPEPKNTIYYFSFICCSRFTCKVGRSFTISCTRLAVVGFFFSVI